MSSTPRPACKHLVLDAGPLLSLSPLRGLADTYLTVPQVLDELKDRRAREHFEQLGLSAGVRVEIRSPDALSLARVIESAKKTGDYSVLSHADLCVLALTYALDTAEKEETSKRDSTGILSQDTTSSTDAIYANPEPEHARATPSEPVAKVDDIAETVENLKIQEDAADARISDHSPEEPLIAAQADGAPNPLTTESKLVADGSHLPSQATDSTIPPTDEDQSAPDSPLSADAPSSETEPETLYNDPSESDDGEGEWITPSNIAVHKSRALNLLPSASSGAKLQPQIQMGAGCMTADFAMQNVLLQMGLNLVGLEGKRIQRVKTWVLRCHACFKICKDASRKFCPTCGNPTLLRASVTIASPDAGPNTPAMQVHLKKNFQYKLRGTIFSIPAPKPGSAKTGPGEGLILREDQTEYARARKRADAQRERDERRMMTGALARGARGEEGGVSVGSWMDPDWMPEMMSVGSGGKGRTARGKGELPVIGHGRKNPNERRRKA